MLSLLTSTETASYPQDHREHRAQNWDTTQKSEGRSQNRKTELRDIKNVNENYDILMENKRETTADLKIRCFEADANVESQGKTAVKSAEFPSIKNGAKFGQIKGGKLSIVLKLHVFSKMRKPEVHLLTQMHHAENIKTKGQNVTEKPTQN